MSDTPEIQTPALFEIEKGVGAFSSSLKAARPFEFGETICTFEASTPVELNNIHAIQIGDGPNDFLNLNSDLAFTNHSCDPNTVFDLSSPDQEDWHVCAIKDIAAGDAITYFYPSTEWELAQPFDCHCGSKNCLGRVSGAVNLSREQLGNSGFVNPHIWRMVEKRDGEAQSKGSAV
ncbi:hypothetical protein FRB94_012747 [Tulasnella sp. JGI-2019a]|nr:hypothetical protein FRB94_012747 [Tulasnella sp. JGI-2019a]KAG9018459.1 hypothetical protein FRB93_000162 [Tulasnella sp. JGI-2019a]